jgi:hypothetical protein
VKKVADDGVLTDDVPKVAGAAGGKPDVPLPGAAGVHLFEKSRSGLDGI